MKKIFLSIILTLFISVSFAKNKRANTSLFIKETTFVSICGARHDIIDHDGNVVGDTRRCFSFSRGWYTDERYFTNVMQ
jgi:hypothetical protein